MTKTLFIYDAEGIILSQQSGQPSPRLPVGVPYIYEEVPEGQQVTGVDVSVTPHKLILEDIPPSEIEQLKQTVADLTEIVLSGGM